MYDIISLGEILIDFTEYKDKGFQYFIKNAGGAPFNLVVAASKYGLKNGFIGAVGNDYFGNFLIQTAKENNVDTSMIKVCNELNTTLVFINLKENGEREFSFFRNNTADSNIEIDINYDKILSSKIFHFGSLPLTDLKLRDKITELLYKIHKKDIIISFDPNFREDLWVNQKEMLIATKNLLNFLDIIKMSEEELYLLSEEKEIHLATEKIMNLYSPEIILVTLGEKGCYYKTGYFSGFLETIKVTPVDTTGAGDIFYGTFLANYLLNNLHNETNEDMFKKVIKRALVTASLSTQKIGGIPSIPDIKEVEQYL